MIHPLSKFLNVVYEVVLSQTTSYTKGNKCINTHSVAEQRVPAPFNTIIIGERSWPKGKKKPMLLHSACLFSTQNITKKHSKHEHENDFKLSI